MADRLVNSKTVMQAYGVTTCRTLMNWTKREDNPLPKPVLGGGTGKGNCYQWLRSSLAEWGKINFGAEIDMGTPAPVISPTIYGGNQPAL